MSLSRSRPTRATPHATRAAFAGAALAWALLGAPVATARAAPPATRAPGATELVSLADDSPRVRLHVGESTSITLGGYLETYYAWNTNAPSNGVTEFRAFDNRHGQLALQAAALAFGFESDTLEARVVAQAGLGPATYYGASEPVVGGTALTPASDPGAWQHLQQAWIAWSPATVPLTVDAGLFLSPIGPESMATHENMHWSHSLLYYALPFYHAGARVSVRPAQGHALRLGLYNGWNNVLDNNDEKTIGLDYTLEPSPELTVGAAYFTGVERPAGAPEGRAWRHLLDAWAAWAASSRVTLVAELDGGIEPNALGTSAWAAASASTRVAIQRWIAVAARSTVFWERRAKEGTREAAPIVLPTGRMTSQTFTVDLTPLRGLGLKLEGRYDTADTEVFFAGEVAGDGSAASPYAPNAREQLTFTLGATAWF